MSPYDASDYVDVAERKREFVERYPEGVLQSWCRPYVEQVGDKSYIVYAAAAYRTPDDPRPGIGWAWEPVPGPTPFTYDSELQNAETSAWGRAILALGFETKKIASAEEVRNRSAGAVVPSPAPAGFPQPSSWKAVQEGMSVYGKATSDDFNAFGVQAREYLYAGKESTGLEPNERKELLRLTGCAVKFIRDMCSPDTLPPPDRKLMRAAWATFLDGAELEGPPWKMGPDETEREAR
jgi:hypothetical protein